MAMFQIYAQSLVRLMEKLQELEAEATKWSRTGTTKERFQEMTAIIVKAEDSCDLLALSSAKKQIARMRAASETGGGLLYNDLVTMIAEMRVRIKEDLEDKVFLCVSDRSLIDRFFIVATKEEYSSGVGLLVPRVAHQLFHPSIVERMEEVSDDIVEACRCFFADRFTASVFHLMRIVEYGLVEVAALAGIEDQKPSWGSLLNALDKLANRTKHDELPLAIQPHIQLIRELLPRLHAIQHAWRNKIVHVENKLIPTGSVTPEIANDIMNAVEIFMKTLVASLPPRPAPNGV